MSDVTTEYVGFRRRALAATIDNLVWLFGIFWILGWVPSDADSISDEAIYVALIVVCSLWFNYFAFAEWRWGQTIGKNATGIEVRSVDGGEINFGQASIRNLLRLVDFFLIGWIMVVATKKKQRLGDKAAKTVVVRRHPQTAAAPGGAE